MTKLTTLKTITILYGLFLFTVSAFSQKIEPDENQTGLILTIDGVSFSWGSHDFNDLAGDPSTRDFTTEGINYRVRALRDTKTKDLGFIANDNKYLANTFCIDSYEEGYEKYIESIELQWSNIPEYGGGLNLYGRSELNNNFDKTNVSSFSEGNDESIILRPTTDNEGKVKIIFEKPIRYIAFTYLMEKLSNNRYTLARFSSIKVHFVNENPIKPKVTVGALGDVEWNPDYAVNGMKIDGLISYNGELADDVKVFYQVVPVFEENMTKVGAKYIQPDEWDKTCGMHKWIWDQMKAIQATGSSKGVQSNTLLTGSHIVDGYYFINAGEVDNNTRNELVFKHDEQSGAYVASITAYFPCSGKYRLIVESNKEDMEVVYETDEWNVYPSLSLAYQYTMNEITFNEGLNINGFSMNDNNELIIDENADKGNLSLYIPGIYLADITYTIEVQGNDEEDTESKESKRRVSYSKSIKNGDPIDISQLGENGGSISFSLSKNGASTPSKGDGNDSKSEHNIMIIFKAIDPTGIKTHIDSDQTVEYYTLQGTKVMKPSKGIYIRVTAAGAEKIVL